MTVDRQSISVVVIVLLNMEEESSRYLVDHHDRPATCIHAHSHRVDMVIKS